MFKYIFSILLMMLPQFVMAQTDSLRIKANEQQLRFGIDISRPIMNAIFDSRKSYEFSLDYHLPNDLYVVAEGGFGGSDIQYSELKYTSSNSFFKIGVDKSMLPRLFPGDWDYLFVGARYGIAAIKRSEASFTTTDPVWGTTTGQIPATSFLGHWAELTAGLRVELLKGFFAGYTVRGKFLINQEPFKELPPDYVAGYGKGEKSTVFDFNFYLQYAIRWK